MAVFRCKMCGGQLEFDGAAKVVKCDYCESVQTLPTFDNEKKINLFSRANALRFNKEFDKASGIYESIVAEFPGEAEAYWGLCLCKYGIEYVDDPKTAKKIPTCHRTITTSIFDDDDFKRAVNNADVISQDQYLREANEIDVVQKQILDYASKAEKYDVFICYKETDDVTGARTEDSIIAQDIYTELTKEGYKVFYSRMTLRDLGGIGYEPYIFSALTSASVMVAIGTKPEYFEAVWVKNEWSRYIKMNAGNPKKALIACYCDMDAYELPLELRGKQALNVRDMTFLNNLKNSISNFTNGKKIGGASVAGGPSIDSLLGRVKIFLGDGDWKQVTSYCERILDIDPTNGYAYTYEFCADFKIKRIEDIATSTSDFDKNDKFKKAMKYASGELSQTLSKLYNDHVEHRYNTAVSKMQEGVRTNNVSLLREAIDLFTVGADDHEPSRNQLPLCKNALFEASYNNAKAALKSGNEDEARGIFESLGNYKDAPTMVQRCRRIETLKNTIEQTNSKQRRLASTINDEKSTVSNINSSRVHDIVWFAVLIASLALIPIGIWLEESGGGSNGMGNMLVFVPFIIAIIIRVRNYYASTLFAIIFFFFQPVLAAFALLRDIISASSNARRHNKTIASCVSHIQNEMNVAQKCKDEINMIISGV